MEYYLEVFVVTDPEKPIQVNNVLANNKDDAMGLAKLITLTCYKNVKSVRQILKINCHMLH